jgi:hypothetical protein
MGGVPFSLTAQPSVPRRSVYGFIERGRVPGLLSAFDFASPDQHAPMRYVTTVPQQALFFLNSPFVAEQARGLVSRPDIAAVPTASEKVRKLYRAIFARDPDQAELDASLKFLSPGTTQAVGADAAWPWQYGTAEFRADTGSVESFTPFAVFVSDRWQGDSVLPAAHSGKAVIRAAGGEPGWQPDQAVVRRWTSPLSGAVTIEGTFRHAQPAVPFGDGVRGRIVSSRHGELASWTVNGSSAETKLGGIRVEKGDQLDFIVDGRSDTESDAFTWAPIVRSGIQSWNAKDDFAGPVPTPLTVWERFAQVLLETNEFAFVD